MVRSGQLHSGQIRQAGRDAGIYQLLAYVLCKQKERGTEGTRKEPDT